MDSPLGSKHNFVMLASLGGSLDIQWWVCKVRN